MKKVLISIATLIFLFTSIYALDFFNDNGADGTLTIQLIDEIGDTVFIEEYDFINEDTLFSILSEEHFVGCADSSFNVTSNCESNMFTSRVILKIDDIETDWTNSYFAIYVNDTYSLAGIDSVNLNNDDVISFEYKLVGGDD